MIPMNQSLVIEMRKISKKKLNRKISLLNKKRNLKKAKKRKVIRRMFGKKKLKLSLMLIGRRLTSREGSRNTRNLSLARDCQTIL
jgi:hypothetical protein